MITPTPISLMGDPVALAAGSSHSLIVVHDGASEVLIAWGNNAHGQLGRSEEDITTRCATFSVKSY